MRLIDTVDVFDGEEREGQHALVERLARLVVGILDLHQVDIGDLAHRLAGVGVVELDLVNAFELGDVSEAVFAALALRAGLVRGAFAVVGFDDQAARGIDHVEITDGVAVLLEHILPVAAGELFRRDVEFENPRGFLAVDLFPALLLGIPQRAFEQAVQEFAVLGRSEAFIALGAAQIDGGVAQARRARRLHRPVVRRAHRLAVSHGLEHRQYLAVAVGLQDVGAELVADPESVADDLKAFGVEVGAGEIAAGRSLDLPITLPMASTRRPVVYLPEVFRSSGASAGASIKDCAGSTACPASLAGNSPSPCANAAVEARNNDATEQSREIRMVSLL